MPDNIPAIVVGEPVYDLDTTVVSIEPTGDERNTNLIELEDANGDRYSWFRKRDVPLEPGDEVRILSAHVKRRGHRDHPDNIVLTHIAFE